MRSMKAMMPSHRSPISICSGRSADSIEVFAAALAFSIASASESASTVKPSYEQPEPDPDDVLAHGAPPSINRIARSGEDCLGFGDHGVGVLPPERRVRLLSLRRLREN